MDESKLKKTIWANLYKERSAKIVKGIIERAVLSKFVFQGNKKR
jgi:hypothetical protein